MSEKPGTYLGKPAGGAGRDAARHLKTLRAMLRSERRATGIWESGVSNPCGMSKRTVLGRLGRRVAALEAAVRAMEGGAL